jgi:hypothetical protein
MDQTTHRQMATALSAPTKGLIMPYRSPGISKIFTRYQQVIKRLDVQGNTESTDRLSSAPKMFPRSPRISMKISTFWTITPWSPLKVNMLCLLPALTLASCFAYSSILKTKATFETSADFQRTTRRYTPQERTLHNHGRQTFKSYILVTFNHLKPSG